MAIGAEGRVLAQRAVGVQGDAGPSLEAPTRGASFGPRDRVAHRIGEAEIEALAVRCVGVERVRICRDVLFEPAEVVRARLQGSGNTPVVVVPDERQQGGHGPIAPRHLARRIVEAHSILPA